MIGDQADCLARIKLLLPPWFGQSVGAPTPVLDAFLNGTAWALAWVFSLYAYIQPQFRVATATEGFLDLIAEDFSDGLRRLEDEEDDAFRARLSAGVLRERCTRAAVVSVVLDLTGQAPLINEYVFSADIMVDAGDVPEDDVLEAIEGVRPVCMTFNVTFL